MNSQLRSYLNELKLIETVEEFEAFKEIIPDKRASLSVSDLQRIKIDNEYDLQHL